MALVKTVEMRVLAKAGDAQEKLDELAAKADSLDGDSVKMRFRVDDADAKAQFDEMRARADRLGFKDVSIKVRVDGAGRAIADLMAVKHEEDNVSGGGLLSRIGGLFGSAGGGIPGAAGPVSLPVLAAAIPVVGALATEAVGLAAGFAAAGAGAGAFALLAMPAIKSVQAAYTGLHAAQQKYAAAQAKEQLDPTKANATAVNAASVNLKLAEEQIAKLPASEQAAIRGLQGLGSEFGKISKAFQPQAFKVFADGLSIARHLLPAVTPFANTFANSLDGLLKRLDKFTQSKGFGDFLKQFHSIEGPAITAIGDGIGKVANSFGKLMTIMSGKDVAHAINIAFGGIAGTINVVTSGLHRFMQNWDGMSAAIAPGIHRFAQNFDSMSAAAARAGHVIVSAFKGIVSGAVSFQQGVDHAFTAVVRGAANMVSGVIHFVSGLPGRIRGFFAGAAGWLVQAGRNIIEGLIHGIESMVGAVGSAISSIAGKIRSFLPFSPAKEGPLSGSGSPDLAGRQIARMLAGGMDSGRGGVAQAAGRLAGAAAGMAGMAGGYGGGAVVNVHFNGITGDKYAVAQQIHQVMRDYKRDRGNAALGLG